MKLQKNDKLVLIGDSITDAERVRPHGEGLFGALGRGYVSQVDALLQSTYPERLIRVVNQGESGNTVRELKNRWQRDVLDKKPDWLSIMIGINDVWRQFDVPWQAENHVAPSEYAATLEELVGQTRPQLKGLVLMTPFFIEPNRSDAMRARMDEYGAIVRELSQKHDAIFVDVQAAFDAVLAHYHPATLAWDRVHPTQAGHMIIARAFLKAVEYSW
jgi:lysophospholipase L1-like esterase